MPNHPSRLLAALLWLTAASGHTEPAKPNVLFIISDDLSYSLSSSGHPECKTPHLDAFAESATSFSRAYCQFPLCGPSRASIMSGQYPKVNGVTGNGGSVKEERVTLPKHFQNHGYWAARVSKIYHMGIPVDVVQGTAGRDHPPSWNATYDMMAMETMTPGKLEDFTDPKAGATYPEERLRWQAAKDSGTPYKMPGTVRGHYAVVEVADEDAGLLPDLMATDQALELLQERAEKEEPFFLAVGFVRPHFPFVSTESDLISYDADNMIYPEYPEDDYDDIPPQAANTRMDFTEDEVRRLRRGYYGGVTFMDQQFGRLLDGLGELGLRENTIVVFVADHGYMLGEHQMWKKSKLWEESIHVPLMISLPGQSEGKLCERPVELIDLYPTLSELAGLPAEPEAQGQSLASLLDDPESERAAKPDALIQVSGGHGLRTERWAFMWYPAKKKDPEAFMLYDMEKDPQQFTNLAKHPEYAGKVEELHERLKVRVQDAEG